jgi:D-serine deaminase-like pyridoxal phosphate-dependent protein
MGNVEGKEAAMGYPQYEIGMSKWDLDTPALVLDVELVERNLAAMAELGRRLGKHIRPHVKTHKTPWLARLQMQHGAIGVSAAKLGEVEAMIQGGVTEILLTSEIAGPRKVARLLALSRHAHLINVVDDFAAAAVIAAAFEADGRALEILVDVNVGTNRTGVDWGEPAVAFAQEIASLPGLRFRGFQGYEGHLQHIYDEAEREAACRAAMERLGTTARLAREAGLPVEIVSTAGTGTARFAAQSAEVTELQPGSYVVMDSDYGRVGGLDFAHSLTILTTVISHASPDRAVCDAGHKTASVDSGMPVVKDRPGVTYVRASDEHGNLAIEPTAGPLKVGDRLELIPSHCDPTINLHDVFYVVRNDTLEAVWPIAARGAIQ